MNEKSRIEGTLSIRNPERVDYALEENLVTEINRCIDAGDLDRVAHLLACSLDGDDPAWRQRVFSNPNFESLHQELWDKIKPVITPEFKDKLYTFLQIDCEWDI